MSHALQLAAWPLTPGCRQHGPPAGPGVPSRPSNAKNTAKRGAGNSLPAFKLFCSCQKAQNYGRRLISLASNGWKIPSSLERQRFFLGTDFKELLLDKMERGFQIAILE